jgi:hypothetical protein
MGQDIHSPTIPEHRGVVDKRHPMVTYGLTAGGVFVRDRACLGEGQLNALRGSDGEQFCAHAIERPAQIYGGGARLKAKLRMSLL